MVALAGANRWQIVSAAVLVESVAGLGYIFSVYSADLKSQFKLTQENLDLLGTLSNIGGNIGIHIGLLQDWVGPAPVVFLAGFVPFGHLQSVRLPPCAVCRPGGHSVHTLAPDAE